MLLILLLPLLTQICYAQTPEESRNRQSGGYGIEPQRLYPGTLLLELLETAETEIDQAVTTAYAEGYKAASLRFAPEAAAFKIAEASLKLKLEKERKKQKRFWPAVGISAGVSIIAGLFLGAAVSR
jgi:hypothetical protein